MVTKIVCERRGGIYARVEPSAFGPTLIYQTSRASTKSFRTKEGKLVGRWALGKKDELGRLRESYPPSRIVLRKPRLYKGSETADHVTERISGQVDAWCDHCGRHHELDLSILFARTRSRLGDVLDARGTVR